MATPAPVIQFLRGSSAKISQGIVSFRVGEPGITTDRGDFYIGSDGTSAGNRFYGSHRYWKREGGGNSLELKLVDANGDVGVSLRSPTNAGAGVTYTLPGPGGTVGHYLKLGTSGVLEWDSIFDGASFDNATLTNSTFTGISTFNGAIVANAGLGVSGGSTFDNINVTGIATVGTTLDVNGLADLTNVNVSSAATISSVDINGGTIDGTTIGGSSPSSGTFTQLNYNSGHTSGISTVGALYLHDGNTKIISSESGTITLSAIEGIDATTKATLEASLALTPNNFDDINVSGISTFQSLANFGSGLNVTSGVSTFSDIVDANGGLDVTGLATLNTGLNVTSGVSTFSGIVDANGGLDVFGHSELDDVNVSGATTVTSLNATGNVILGSDSSDTLTVNANSTFNGTLTGTATTATRAQGIDVTETTTGTEHYITFVSNSTTTNAATLRVEGSLAYNPTDNALKVANVKTDTVQHTNGTSAIIISSNGNVGIAQTLTVEGDLNIKGSATTVNTTELKVEDVLIDLGLENSNGSLIPPTTSTTTDVGTVLNYYSTSARKAAFYWDHNTSRVAIAASVSESAGVLTVQDWGTLAAGSILINGKLTVNDCAGSSDVITCTGSERFLKNITIDAGEF